MKITWAPSEWKIYKVGDVFKRVRRPVAVEAKTIYREIGIRSHGKGIFHKKETTGAGIGNKRVFWIEPGCFVVNIVFAWEGAVAQTSNAEQGMIASHRFPMYKPVDGLLDLDFATYFFKSQRGNHLLRLASPGGAGRNKTLGQQEFSKLEIPLPPIAVQKTIGAILRDCDEAITLMERLIEAKQKRKKGLMQQLLTGKVRFPGFEDQWQTVRFDDVLDIEIGRTPSRKIAEYWDKEKTSSNIWLSIADLSQKYVRDSKEYVSDRGIAEANMRLVPAGTVIMSFKLTIGRAALLKVAAYTNEAICSLIPKNSSEVDNHYLFHALNVVNFDHEIDQAIKGKTLNKSKLKRLRLALPSYTEQQKIASVFNTCDDEITLLQQKAAALRQQKKGLMQQLLTGKVRVKG